MAHPRPAVHPRPVTTIACLALLLFVRLVLADYRPTSLDRTNPYPRQSFLSLPGAIAPIAQVSVLPQDDASPAPHIIWTPTGINVPKAWPMVLDTRDLSLIWHGFSPSTSVYIQAASGTVQECNGTKYITFWSGGLTRGGFKGGRYYILDQHYNLAYNITGHGDLTTADGHELFLTPECTAVYSAYQPRLVNDTLYHFESYFQEIDLASGKLLFQWNASRHVDVADSYWNSSIRDAGHSSSHAWDWFHVNSIAKDSKGNYLVSARHTHALYYISRTGDILWQLGGKKDMFVHLDGNASHFSWQHHARWVDDTRIALYDNRMTQWHPDSRQSRGVILQLDLDHMTVRVDHEYPTHANTTRLGSMQVFPNGNVLLGFGNEPAMTEYTSDGTVVWDAQFAPAGFDRDSPDHYRAIKVNWTGAPLTRPDIAPGPPPVYETVEGVSRVVVGPDLANDTVYFSWNGATEVERWVVLASNGSQLSTRDVWARVDRRGFEMSVFVGVTQRVAVMAIGSDGKTMGITRVIGMSHGAFLEDVKVVSGAGSGSGLSSSWSLLLLSGGAVGSILFYRRRARPHPSPSYGPLPDRVPLDVGYDLDTIRTSLTDDER